MRVQNLAQGSIITMADGFEAKPNQKYRLPADVKEDLLIAFPNPCFVALHGSVLWKYREPKDIDILYVVEKHSPGLQNLQYGRFDISVMTRNTFNHCIYRMDVQYLIYLWLPSDYILDITSEFRDYLDETACAFQTQPRACEVTLRSTNTREVLYSWMKARRLLVQADEKEKAMKCMLCSFRRVLLMNQLLEAGKITNFEVASAWWLRIESIFNDEFPVSLSVVFFSGSL